MILSEGDKKEEPRQEVQEEEDLSGNGPISKGTGRRRSERSSPGGSRLPEKRDGNEEELSAEGAEDTPGRTPTRAIGHLTRKAGAPGAQPVDRDSSLERPDSPIYHRETGPGGPMDPERFQPGGRQLYLVQGPSTEGPKSTHRGPQRRIDGGDRPGSLVAPFTPSPTAHPGEGVPESHTARASRGPRVRHHPGRTQRPRDKGGRGPGQGQDAGRRDPSVPRPQAPTAQSPVREAEAGGNGHDQEDPLPRRGRRKRRKAGGSGRHPQGRAGAGRPSGTKSLNGRRPPPAQYGTRSRQSSYARARGRGQGSQPRGLPA